MPSWTCEVNGGDHYTSTTMTKLFTFYGNYKVHFSKFASWKPDHNITYTRLFYLRLIFLYFISRIIWRLHENEACVLITCVKWMHLLIPLSNTLFGS